MTPTVADVDRIAAISDPIIRNLQITQCYHELSAAFAARTGPGANWCTFATWASKQAGQTIRKEDLTRTLESAFAATVDATQAAVDVTATAQRLGARGPAAEIQESTWEVLNPFAAIDRASDAVARGNKKVFEEIGLEFARFCAACLLDAVPDADHLALFCTGLRPGDPPDGQNYLRQAFTHYYHALFEPDPSTRAQLQSLANLEIGFHEQTRLQPEIVEALDAAFVDPVEFRKRLLKAIFPLRGWWARVRLFFMRLFGRPTAFDTATATLATAARQQAQRLITATMMTLGLPHGVRLRLGEDLTAPFPAVLQHITLPELQALLARIDPTPDSTLGSGAVDWGDLADRIHFIADLFRCYHESPDLLVPPFSPEQVTALQAGQLPAGRL